MSPPKDFAATRFTSTSAGKSTISAVALHMAYYNFSWRPRYQDWSGKAGRLRPTPAMMAGITNRLWKFDDLFSEVKARYLEW